MGLDVFHDGSWTVRLSVQRLLILWLCLFSVESFALPVAPEGWVQYSSTRKCTGGWIDGNYVETQQSYDDAHGCAERDEGSLKSYWLPRCRGDHQRCEFYAVEDIPPYKSGSYLGQQQWTARYTESIFYYNGRNEPEYCKEQGLNYDPNADDGAECQQFCAHGSLDGTCLPPPEPEQECTPDSPDYRGKLVVGYGTEPTAMCGDYDQCQGGEGGSVGFVNGELRCIADDYGAPKCKGGTIGVIDDYGFACETLQDQPDPEVAEQPNTDTDGDGEPDEYQRENDPESIEKAIDKLNETVADGNTTSETSNQHLSKIEKALGGIDSNVAALKTMGENGELAGGGGGSGGDGAGLINDQGEDYLGDLADIKQNTRDSADVLQAFEESNEAPEGGFDSSELDNIVPTFEQSGAQFKAAIMNLPIAQSFQDFANISENNVCPVYTLPATPISGSIDMDIHCRVIAEYGALIQAMFMFFWVGLAFFVFFRA